MLTYIDRHVAGQIQESGRVWVKVGRRHCHIGEVLFDMMSTVHTEGCTTQRSGAWSKPTRRQYALSRHAYYRKVRKFRKLACVIPLKLIFYDMPAEQKTNITVCSCLLIFMLIRKDGNRIKF